MSLMVPRMVPKIVSLKSTYSELSNAPSNVFISQKVTEIHLFKVRYNYPVQVNILTSFCFTQLQNLESVQQAIQRMR